MEQSITVIAEHSVDLSLLPEEALILDAGCRGWAFYDYFKGIGHNVVALDIDESIPMNGSLGRILHVMALSDVDGWVGKKANDDPQATSIDKKGSGIESITLGSLVKTYGQQFDLIKLDIEGSEYDVIMSLEEAPAKQLSIEFHLHTGVYTHHEITMMENKLIALGYFPVKHDMTEQHGAGMNYWDSLWILK